VALFCWLIAVSFFSAVSPSNARIVLRFTTAGESHGPALVAVLEGMPAGLPLLAEDIDRELRRRQQGYGRGRRMQIEQDAAELLSLYAVHDWQGFFEKVLQAVILELSQAIITEALKGILVEVLG